MKPYLIVLSNNRTDESFHRAVYWSLSFPEAVREAYKIKYEKGQEWNVSSVGIDTQWVIKWSKQKK